MRENTTEVPVCIYATKAKAKAAEGKAREEIADVLKKHGAIAAVIVIGMVHRESDGTRLNVGIEGAGSPDHVNQIAADVLHPRLLPGVM